MCRKMWVPAPLDTTEKVLVPLKSVSDICFCMASTDQVSWWPDSAVTQAGGKAVLPLPPPEELSCSELLLFCMFLFHLGDCLANMHAHTHAELFLLFPRAHGSGNHHHQVQGAEMCLQNSLTKSQTMEECWVNFSSEYQLKVIYTPN